jgi:L-ribulose-5-phosphate 3-epimerase
MKKGISVWSFSGKPLPECFRLARETGFDGLEVALAETGEINLQSTEAEMLKIGDLARENGIALYSVASGLYWTYSLTSDDAAVREKAKAIVRKQLTIARWLHCDTILVVPGCVKSFAPNSPIVPYDKVYDRALHALKELAPSAEQAGVAIGIENVWNQFLLSPLEMRDLIDAVGSPAVGAYFDAGNVIAFGHPQHWIPILGSRIRKVHIKDYRFAAGGLTGFVDLLAGDVDFPAVMDALRQVGYDDWITAEMGTYAHYPNVLLQNTSNAMDQILGR